MSAVDWIQLTAAAVWSTVRPEGHVSLFEPDAGTVELPIGGRSPSGAGGQVEPAGPPDSKSLDTGVASCRSVLSHLQFADDTFVVAASSTATHWLPGPELAAMYRQLARVLTPAGVVLNADYIPLDDHAPRIADATKTIDTNRQHRLLADGASSWEDWWATIGAQDTMSERLDRRAAIFPPDTGPRRAADLDMHQAALRDAGFTETAIVWQDLQERLLVALK